MSLKMVFSWNVRTIPRRAALWGPKPVTSRPSNQTSPDEGARKELISLKQVLLPAPLGPMMDRISPADTEKLTLFTAVRPPNRRVRALTSSCIASAASGGPAPDDAEHAVGHEQDAQDHQPRKSKRLITLKLME